jgi:hypothetical protein
VILISSLLLTFRLLLDYDINTLIHQQELAIVPFTVSPPTSSSSSSSFSSTSSSPPSSSSNTAFPHFPSSPPTPLYDFDTSFLLCTNQSLCLPPILQVTIPLHIYLCKHTSQGGVRFFYLVKDGLLLHPHVVLSDTPLTDTLFDSLDYVFYLPNSSPWPKSECGNPKYASKLIVLDEFDGSLNFAPFSNKEERLKHYLLDPHTNAPLWNFLFFKRSYVRREDGVFVGYPHLAKKDVYPMVYSIASGYLQETFHQERDREIACTLRGSEKQTTRLRVQQWVADYILKRNLTNSTHGEVRVVTPLLDPSDLFPSSALPSAGHLLPTDSEQEVFPVDGVGTHHRDGQPLQLGG